MSLNVLGVSCLFHDAAAALLIDGEIAFAAQEERYVRKKNYSGWPTNAITRALQWTRKSLADVDLIVYYEDPWAKFPRVLDTYLERAPRGFADFSEMSHRWSERNLTLEGWIREQLGPASGFRGRICFARHHASHAAAAFYPSPFASAAIMTLDAVGEWSTSSIGVGRGHQVELLEEQRFPHSIGMLYSAFTHFLGFTVNEGEYKLMGLAPYGKPTEVDLIRERLVSIDDTGAVRLNMDCFDFMRSSRMTNERFHALFGMAPRDPKETLTQRHMDIAASIQVVCEEVVLRSARHAHQLTGEKNLVLGGGVALNCVANGRLVREGPFERVWVQPAAGDAGGALGAALLGWHGFLDKPRVPSASDSQRGSLLGESFSQAECQAVLSGLGAVFDVYQEEKALLDRVAGILAEGNVVGWFQGRMEYGPRSLGSRSILGDARPIGMQSKINLSIKFRESFRPFAPAVLREEVGNCFAVPEAARDLPYMLFVHPVSDSWREQLTADDQRKQDSADLMERLSIQRSRIPAVTHVDYSARIQTVDEERHGRYYRLLKRFHEITGCPVLVNTSFNVANEPIVGSPEDAFFCFMKTKMDYLVVEGCVLDKRKQPEGLLAHVVEDY